MKREDIAKALTEVNEKYVEESRPKARKRVRWGWIATAAAMLLVAVFGGWLGAKAIMNRQNERNASVDPTAAPTAQQTALPGKQTAIPVSPLSARMLASAEYPLTPGVDDGFWKYEADLRDNGVFGAGAGLSDFYTKIVNELLEGEENGICSPYNIYMALAMLAEITDGSSRAQILGLLGADSIESVREQYGRLFDASYRNADGYSVLIPAASIWMRDGYEYNADAIETLKSAYRASSGCGQMGDHAYDALIESWINEMTHGLLADSAKKAAETTPDEVLKLISTLYYKASWSGKFYDETYEEVFHGSKGDQIADFMHGEAGVCYKMDGYTLVGKGLVDKSIMWFILPDEGVELSDIVKSGAPLTAVLDRDFLPGESIAGTINFNMPKLDIRADFSLVEALQKLGVTDCFNPSFSDFSPLSDETLFVSEAQHSARLIADTEGVEAAAFTMIAVNAGGLPQPPEITITLDRPFMFILTSMDNTPLFVGTVFDL